jgi:hypothetical protein
MIYCIEIRHIYIWEAPQETLGEGVVPGAGGQTTGAAAKGNP